MSPKLVEVGRHVNIELLTLSEVVELTGEAGNFTVRVAQHPRYIDKDKCIACGLCAEKCPKKVDDEFNLGLNQRKAAYVKYSQAVPLKYAIDSEHCIYFLKCRCRACEKFCPTSAINFDEPERELTLNVGAVVLALGGELYDPAAFDTYGSAKFPNVLTSIEFERMLSPSGPFGGHIVNPADNSDAHKVAWIQCVGSRDVHKGAKSYCSSICCTHAIKQALVAKEHSPGLETTIFYIDIRTHGKDFERYYNRARDQAGVRFVKSRISSVQAAGNDKSLLLRYTDRDSKRVEEEFDLVVLSVGLCAPHTSRQMTQVMDIEVGDHDYPVTTTFDPISSTRSGIFMCGAYQGPKDIPSSVIDASAAAAAVSGLLAKGRKTLTREQTPFTERNIQGLAPRIGVFVCHCGTNIAGVVDVAAVAEYARSLPHVAHVEENLFSCSQDSQEHITKSIQEHRLNRVVVAACTPRTHEALFQQTLLEAGLNKHLFEMANIRNQCSWVHSNDTEAATRKAKDLVRMAVAKAALLQPLSEGESAVNQSALIIGGGVAGMTAAKNLANQGFHSYLVEKSDRLGGQANNLYRTWKNEPVAPLVNELIRDVENDGRIEVILNAEPVGVEGFVGAFETTVAGPTTRRELQHGVTIIASGAGELKPRNHLYGRDERVHTALELDRMLQEDDSNLDKAENVVFIQCAGSRIPERPYCSKVCCAHSISSALALKRRNPGMNIYIVYRDMRPYGLREDLYRTARMEGIHFLRYELEQGLCVEEREGGLIVEFIDYVLQKPLRLQADLLVLASAIIAPDNTGLCRLYKVPINEDGFFVEAHVKLRPVDFATDGIFMCGLAHSPKPLDEAIAQAQAAAARAAIILCSTGVKTGGVVAEVNPSLCTGCGVCVEVCPYKAITLNEKHKAVINEVLCKGCGNCASSCRSGAPSLRGFTDAGILAQVTSCLNS